MSATQHQDDPEDEAFLRGLVLPQEERMRLGIPWHGGYRWFRSPNIIPIEELRRRRKQRERGPATPVTPAPKPAA